MQLPHIAYAITELYCMVYASTILVRLNRNIGSEHEVQELRNLIYAYLGMLATDIFWAFFEDNILIPGRFVNAAVNAVTLISISLGCYFWYRFVDDRLHRVHRHRRLHRILANLPILLICVLDAVSVFTGWMFYIDADNHYETGPYFDLQTVVNYGYLLIPTVASVYRAIRTKSKAERTEYSLYAGYMVAPLISGFLEDTFPTAPLLALNIFMVIHILFVMIQNKQIYNDALTDLNNRRRLDLYVEEQLPKVSAERPLLLFMMDINRFKAINDACGHIEGDNALKTFSGVLKTAAGKYGAFAARYGGDEFCLVMDAAGREPEAVAQTVQSRLGEVQKEKNCPYQLTVSIGYTVCTRADEDTAAVFDRADEALYLKKKEWHRAND